MHGLHAEVQNSRRLVKRSVQRWILSMEDKAGMENIRLFVFAIAHSH
jgi:hypothetical protein